MYCCYEQTDHTAPSSKCRSHRDALSAPCGERLARAPVAACVRWLARERLQCLPAHLLIHFDTQKSIVGIGVRNLNGSEEEWNICMLRGRPDRIGSLGCSPNGQGHAYCAVGTGMLPCPRRRHEWCPIASLLR